MKFIQLIIVCLVLLLTGCSSTTSDPEVVFKGQSEYQIYTTGYHYLLKGKYSKAIKNFEGLQALYPFGAYAQQTDLYIIYAYYMDDDIASAEAAADKYTRLYPRDANADYAYYMKGLSNFEQDRGWFQRYFPTDLTYRDPGSARNSFSDFASVIQLFPESPYAPDARQHMVYLRDMYAAYELNVAHYYMIRGAYVAAANRANYVLQHYDGTPEVEDALGILVIAYDQLNLPDLAGQALEVLRYNYPNGVVLHDLNSPAHARHWW